MKHILILLFLCISLCFLFSCKRKSSCEYTETKQIYYNLKESNKARIPYTGLDTLIFISDAGDTAILYGHGKKQYYKSFGSKPNNADCGIPEFKYNYENIDYSFLGTNLFLSRILFSAFMYDEISNPTLNSITISTNFLTKISSFEYVDHTAQLKDSVFVNGKTQYGVYLEISENKSVLFNYQMGVLRIEDINGKIWIKYK